MVQYVRQKWKWTGFRNPWEGKKPLDPIAKGKGEFPGTQHVYGGAAVDSYVQLPIDPAGARVAKPIAQSIQGVLKTGRLSWIDDAGGLFKRQSKIADMSPSVAKQGDDLAAQVAKSKPGPEPFRGLQTNKTWWHTSAKLGGGGVALGAAGAGVGYGIKQVTKPLAAAVGPEGPAGAAGDTLTEFVGDLGGAFRNLFGGLGLGAGEGVAGALSGTAAGLQRIAGPALLLGAGFLAFTLLRK